MDLGFVRKSVIGRNIAYSILIGYVLIEHSDVDWNTFSNIVRAIKYNTIPFAECK